MRIPLNAPPVNRSFLPILGTAAGLVPAACATGETCSTEPCYNGKGYQCMSAKGQPTENCCSR